MILTYGFYRTVVYSLFSECTSMVSCNTIYNCQITKRFCCKSFACLNIVMEVNCYWYYLRVMPSVNMYDEVLTPHIEQVDP